MGKKKTLKDSISPWWRQIPYLHLIGTSLADFPASHCWNLLSWFSIILLTNRQIWSKTFLAAVVSGINSHELRLNTRLWQLLFPNPRFQNQLPGNCFYDVHFEFFHLIYPTLWGHCVQFHNECTLDSNMCVSILIHFLPLIPLLVPPMPVFALREEAGVPTLTQGEHTNSMCVFILILMLKNKEITYSF